MCDPRFAMDVDRDKTPIGVFSQIQGMSLVGLDLEIALRELYEESYGIFDHAAEPDNPLNLMAMHPAEDYTSGSGLYNALRRYRKHGIGEIFHISVIDFVNLPREIVEELISLSIVAGGSGPAARLKELETLMAAEEKNK